MAEIYFHSFGVLFQTHHQFMLQLLYMDLFPRELFKFFDLLPWYPQNIYISMRKKKKHGKCLTGFGEYHFAVKILHTGLKHKPPLPLFISLRRLKCTLLRNFSMKMRYFLRREQIHCLLCSSDFITTLASAMLPQDQDYIRPIPTFMHINLSLNILQEFACCKTSHVIKSC